MALRRYLLRRLRPLYVPDGESYDAKVIREIDEAVEALQREPLPKSVRLDVPPVEDMGELGASTAFAVAAMIESLPERNT